jgi:hypothetical protein
MPVVQISDANIFLGFKMTIKCGFGNATFSYDLIDSRGMVSMDIE